MDWASNFMLFVSHELNFSRDAKNNKGSYRYIGQKMKIKQNNKTEIVTTNMEETKELNKFFACFQR